MSERTYHWPHEMVNTISEASKLPQKDAIRLVTIMSEYNGNHVQYIRAYNGNGSETLIDKFAFVELATKLGLKPPVQWQGSDFIPHEHKEEATDYVVKPKNGANGVGFRTFSDPFEVAQYVACSEKEQIVQNKVPLEGEIRYASYRRPYEDSVMRIALNRRMPKLNGDGHSRLFQLIMQNDAPLYYKAAVVGRMKDQLLRVPEHGEVIPLATGGNWRLGAYETLLEDEKKLAQIDQYVDTVCRRLEEKINGVSVDNAVNLRYIAMDLGVRNWEGLDTQGLTVQDAINESLCPIEFQFPFSTGSYYANIPGTMMEKIVTTTKLLPTLRLYTHLELLEK